MDKQKKYSLRKIAGIGLTSCVVGISVMNMPVQAEEGTDAATTAVSETVENAEATSPSENADETVAENNEATANEASSTAAEQPSVEEEATNPVEEAAEQPAAEEEATSPAEEAASQPSETEEVAPESQNKDAQPSNTEANDKSNQLDSNNNDVIYGDGYNTRYISHYDKNKGELGRLKVNLTVDGKRYEYFDLVGYEGEVVTPELINKTIDKLGGTESIIPDGYQFERKSDQTYTIHEGQSKEITLNLVRSNPSHEKVEYKFISKIYTGYNSEYVGVYNFITTWPEKGTFITGYEIDDNIRNNYLWPFKNKTMIAGWSPMGWGPEDDGEGVYAGNDAYYVYPLSVSFNNSLEEINLSKSDNRDDRDGRFLTVNIYKDKQLLRSIRISGYLGDTAQPDDIAKALNDLKMPEGYTFKEANNTAYQLTGTFKDRQTLTYNIVPIHPSSENGEFTITIKDKNGKVYGQKTINEPKGTAITTFEINNIAMELKDAATFPAGTDIQPYDLFAGKPYYYVGKDAGYDYILNAVSEESNNNTPSTDNKDPENNQNNTNGSGTTQTGNTNNGKGQTNTGGNTNNQTGENSSNTNQEGNNTTKPTDNSDKAYTPVNIGGEPSEEDLKDPHFIKLEILDENNVPHILGGFKRALGTTFTKQDIRESMLGQYYTFGVHDIDLANDDAGDYDLVYNQEAYEIGKDRVISIRLVKKQNNTNGSGTTQTNNTNNDNGQTNTGGDTNNQTGENGTATNQEGNTSQNSNNNGNGQKPSKSGNSQSETAGLSRLAARKAKEDLPKAGMKENSLALLGFALFALTGGVSAKRVFHKK